MSGDCLAQRNNVDTVQSGLSEGIISRHVFSSPPVEGSCHEKWIQQGQRGKKGQQPYRMAQNFSLPSQPFVNCFRKCVQLYCLDLPHFKHIECHDFPPASFFSAAYTAF
ncbi:unnamed protein product [Protopolystoma xenopodis]|uniref:Uncharacterized protein n=1 Tax=Protopolystoma xenopodis TaxID=117903 RepID=A0A3S5B3B4_9PLAT|nr:unnamed protein product [Protopolystoma xenopodis]